MPGVRLRQRWYAPLSGVVTIGAMLLAGPVVSARAQEFSREVRQPVHAVSESMAESLARPSRTANRQKVYSLRHGTMTQPPRVEEYDVGQAEEPGGVGAERSTAGPLVGESFTSFDGPSQRGFITPPDPVIAVGQNHIVVGVNGEIAVYTRAGNRVFSQTWEDFFAPADPDGNVDFTSDPKVLYDTQTGRFFVMILGLEGTEDVTGSSYLIAVTQTGDPTGVWNKFMSESTSGGAWSDYPGFGIDDNALYVTANFFTIATGQFTNVSLRVYEKDQFLAFNVPNELAFIDNTNIRDGEEANTGDPSFTIQPAVSYISTELEWMVSAKFPPVNTNFVILYSLNGRTSPRTIRKFRVPLPTRVTYSFPGLAIQPGGTPVDALDGRMLNAVRIGNSLWACHTTLLPTGSGNGARWYEFDVSNPNNPTVRQTGIVSISGGSCFTPGICANDAGDAVMTYSRVRNPGEFISMYYSARGVGDPADEMPTTVRVQAGAPIAYAGFRWGDYAGAALDPLDRSSIWVFNETATSAFFWRTTIAKVPIVGGGGGGTNLCPQSLEVVSPDGGETLITGDTAELRWSGIASNDPFVLVNLLLARFNPDSGQSEILGFVRNSSGGIDFSASATVANWIVGTPLRHPTDPGTLVEVPPSGDFADYQLVVRSVFCPTTTLDSSTNFFRILERLQVTAATDAAVIVRGESATLTATVTGGRPSYTFRWTPAESLDNPTIFRPIATPAGGTRTNCDPDLECVTYTVEVRDSVGANTQMATASVVVKIADPLRVDAGPTKVFPAGGTVLLEGFATGGARPYTYLWSPIPDPTQLPGSDGANVAQPIARPSGDTVYTLTVTDRLGAVESDTVGVLQGYTVTVLNQPVNGGTVTRDLVKAVYLPGEQIAFTATAASGFTFLRWEVGPPGGTPLTFTDNPVLVAVPSQNINVVAVYAPGGDGATRPQSNGGMLPGLDLMGAGCGLGLVGSLLSLSAMLAAGSVVRSRRRR